MGDLHYINRDADQRSDLDRAFAPPWFEDVFALADLWHWLTWRKCQPRDAAYFFTHGIEWTEEYARLVKFKGGAL